MDQFYLRNKNLYQRLVQSWDPSAPVPHFSRHVAAPTMDQESIENEKPARRCNADLIVSARIRPMLEDDIAAGFPRATYPRTGQETQVLDLHDLYNHPTRAPILKSTKHEVDQLFDSDVTTDQIYDSLVVDLVSWAKEGRIATLFAYGQTGSGKTFTISEFQRLAVLSLLEDDDEDEIYVTIFELAGKAAFDLLDSRKPVKVLEDSSGTTHIRGAEEVQISENSGFQDLLEEAASFRRTARTMKNDGSSRSHAICRIRIKKPGRKEDGVLYLVDLAGSEVARDIFDHSAARMKETREINMSLSVLKDCIRGKMQADALRGTPAAAKVRVPYRQTTLTKVLKHVFDPVREGHTRTVMIACVNPCLADSVSSKNTLRYAEMMRGKI